MFSWFSLDEVRLGFSALGTLWRASLSAGEAEATDGNLPLPSAIPAGPGCPRLCGGSVRTGAAQG